jgi:hypothetical protein
MYSMFRFGNAPSKFGCLAKSLGWDTNQCLVFNRNSDGPPCCLMISKHERWYNNSVHYTSVEKVPGTGRGDIYKVVYSWQLAGNSQGTCFASYLPLALTKWGWNISLPARLHRRRRPSGPPEGRLQALIWFSLISFHICHRSEYICMKFGESKGKASLLCPGQTRIPNVRLQNRKQSVNYNTATFRQGSGF